MQGPPGQTTACGSPRGRAIAWSVRAPGRFAWANRLKVPIPSYGGWQMHAERAWRSTSACGRACSAASPGMMA